MRARYNHTLSSKDNLFKMKRCNKRFHWTIAKSLSEVRLLFFALCPGCKNSVFLFFVSVFFCCFLIFFLAAMSGLATAWGTKGKIGNHDNTTVTRFALKLLTSRVSWRNLPAGPCVSCVRLVCVWPLSAQQQRRARTSQDPPASSVAQWAPGPGSSVWGLNQTRLEESGNETYWINNNSWPMSVRNKCCRYLGLHTCCPVLCRAEQWW